MKPSVVSAAGNTTSQDRCKSFAAKIAGPLSISDQSLIEIFLAVFCCLCLLFLHNHWLGASPFCFTLIPKQYEIKDPVVTAALMKFYELQDALMTPMNQTDGDSLYASDYLYYGAGCTWNQ